MTQQQEFNPLSVPISYTLNIAQANLLIKGLGKLPREESEGFYDQFRAVALQTLQAAEHLHNNPAPVAAPAAANDVAEAKPKRVYTKRAAKAVEVKK